MELTEGTLSTTGSSSVVTTLVASVGGSVTLASVGSGSLLIRINSQRSNDLIWVGIWFKTHSSRGRSSSLASVALASVSGVTLGSTSVALVSSKATETTKATLVVT